MKERKSERTSASSTGSVRKAINAISLSISLPPLPLSLLYIYSNGIILAVLAPGRGASFAIVISRLYLRRDTI